ncbi:MAG: hypothetical protein ABWJ98_04125 [Hydrogenothermaceae bacterium]
MKLKVLLISFSIIIAFFSTGYSIDELYIKVKVESVDKASNTIHATGLTGPCKGYHLILKSHNLKAEFVRGKEIFVLIDSNTCKNNGVYELKEVSP